MMSETQYEKMNSPNRNIFSAIQRWRRQLDGKIESGLNRKELEAIRKESANRDFTWKEQAMH